MPQIIPIRDLKNTSEISERCHSSNEPIFITKNGYGDMVIMSMETYEKGISPKGLESSIFLLTRLWTKEWCYIMLGRALCRLYSLIF
jgi:hypothetical protein